MRLDSDTGSRPHDGVLVSRPRDASDPGDRTDALGLIANRSSGGLLMEEALPAALLPHRNGPAAVPHARGVERQRTTFGLVDVMLSVRAAVRR
jgi:hypothetical protein